MPVGLDEHLHGVGDQEAAVKDDDRPQVVLDIFHGPVRLAGAQQGGQPLEIQQRKGQDDEGNQDEQHDGAGDDPVRPAFGKICSRPGGGGTEREVNLMEEKDVQRLLDMLYSMIDEAKSAAFSSDKCVISRDEALDLLDDIRAKLPLEIKKAQELVRAREEYVSSAKKEVEKMLRQAELDAKVIVSESETLQQARRKSSEIIRRAEERSKELYHVANTYTEDALRRTEEAIQAALDEVKESRVRFRATSNEQMQANQEKLRERRSASEQPQSDEDA